MIQGIWGLLNLTCSFADNSACCRSTDLLSQPCRTGPHSTALAIVVRDADSYLGINPCLSDGNLPSRKSVSAARSY